MSLFNAKPKSIKIDLARGEINVTFSVVLNNENQEQAESLVKYMNPDLPRGTLTFVSQQQGLFLKEIKPEMTTKEDRND